MNHRVKHLTLGVATLLSAVALSSAAVAAPVTLQNDGWVDMTAAGFQGGFVSGEMGAAVFVAEPDHYPYRIQSLRLLFGGDQEGVEREITVRVWRDSGGDSPGPELYSVDVQIQASTQAFSEVDLSGANLTINEGNVRVGVEFKHNGFPAIARDDDPGSGNDFANRNYIFAQGIGWVQSQLLGVLGDWVMRLNIETSGGNTTMDSGMPPDTSQPPADTSQPPADTSQPPADTGGGGTADTGGNAGALGISNVTPSSGTNDQDTNISIIGSGFAQGVTFRIGSTQIRDIVVQNPNAAIGVVPSGIIPGTYDVTANLGTNQVIFNQGFTVLDGAGDGDAGIGTSGGDDGCAVAPGQRGAGPIALLLLAAGLFTLRRRR